MKSYFIIFVIIVLFLCETTTIASQNVQNVEKSLKEIERLQILRLTESGSYYRQIWQDAYKIHCNTEENLASMKELNKCCNDASKKEKRLDNLTSCVRVAMPSKKK